MNNLKKILSVMALTISAFSANAAPIFASTDAIFGGQSDGTNFEVGTAGTAGGENNWPTNENPYSLFDLRL